MLKEYSVDLEGKPLIRCNSILLVMVMILGLCRAGTAAEFLHPGITLSKADLEALKANLNTEPWKSGYKALAADGRSQLNYKMRGPFEVVTRNPHRNRPQWMSDMQAAFNLSLMWYFTGDARYAQKSHDILIAWATTQKTFGGRESNLDLGDYAQCFAGSADILRGTWPGWTPADTATIKALFNDVYWPGCAGAIFAPGPANKGTLSMAAAVAIAVFNDDQAKLDHVLYMFRTAAACALPNTLPTGEIGESARDQGHAYGQLISMVFLAEVCWKQGIDIYSECDNRLLAVGEYSSRFNLGIKTPYVPFGATDALYLTNETAVWGHNRRGLNILINAYETRKGLIAPYMDMRRETLPEDSESFLFRKVADNSKAAPLRPIVFPATESVTEAPNNLDLPGQLPNGDAVYRDGVWTVNGGDKPSRDDDSFHFSGGNVNGDCAILAKVVSVQNTHPDAAAGVMIRDSLEANAPNRAWIGITPGKRYASDMRGWTGMRGGSNWQHPSREIPDGPYWVKIERQGKVISTFTSPDGVSWAVAGVGDYGNIGETAYIGLAVCSRVPGTLNTATFTDVRMTGGDGKEPPKTPAAPLAILGSPGDKKVPLRWLESFGAVSYNVKRATKSGGPYNTVANVKNTSYVDVGVTDDVCYYYVVSAVNSAGKSENSAEDEVTPRSDAAREKQGIAARK